MSAKPTDTAVEPVVQITLPAATARIVVDALDLYARVGLGQLDDIVSLGRLGVLKNAKGETPTYDDMEDAEQHINAAKKSLFGFASNASHGIYSDKISARFRTIWGVMTAIRHRLAWDRTPEGGFQTSFDEPMRGDAPEGVQVSSASMDDVLSQLPKGMLLTRLGDAWAVVRVHPEQTGSPLQLLGQSHSLQTAVQKAKNAVSGAPDET